MTDGAWNADVEPESRTVIGFVDSDLGSEREFCRHDRRDLRQRARERVATRRRPAHGGERW